MTSYGLAALAAVSSANAVLSLLETMPDESTKPSRKRRAASVPCPCKAVASQTAEPEAESWKF
jgi:hypothetical protein